MAKYRYQDRQEQNEHGQTLGYALWMGGPSLTYVGGIVCKDGTKANWFKTSEPDTWFSMPGYIHRRSRKVYGFLSCDDGLYQFTPYQG
jgi:hypothetical protein